MQMDVVAVGKFGRWSGENAKRTISGLDYDGGSKRGYSDAVVSLLSCQVPAALESVCS